MVFKHLFTFFFKARCSTEVANTLAYYRPRTITTVKGLIVHAPFLMPPQCSNSSRHLQTTLGAFSGGEGRFAGFHLFHFVEVNFVSNWSLQMKKNWREKQTRENQQKKVEQTRKKLTSSWRAREGQ